MDFFLIKRKTIYYTSYYIKYFQIEIIFFNFIPVFRAGDSERDESGHLWSGYPSNNHGHHGGLHLHAVVPLF